MSVGAPPPAPGTLFVGSTGETGSEATFQWLGPFTLQSATEVQGAYSDVSGSTGGSMLNSWRVTPGPKQQFFRLRQ